VPPDGRLEPAIYHVIGQAYRHIERIEPYLEQAVPVTEAALLGSGDTPCNEVDVRRAKVLVFSGCESHPATWSFWPVAVQAARKEESRSLE
jgi:hypothetical protein